MPFKILYDGFKMVSCQKPILKKVLKSVTWHSEAYSFNIYTLLGIALGKVRVSKDRSNATVIPPCKSVPYELRKAISQKHWARHRPCNSHVDSVIVI